MASEVLSDNIGGAVANNFAEAMQQGYAAGAQQRQDREQRNRLAEIQGLAPRVISGDLEATNRAFALDPRAAQTFQAEGTRQRQQLRGLAKSLKQAEVNPQLQSALYRQAVPYLRAQFGAEIPEAFDAASVMPVVDQVLASTSDLDGGGEQFTLSPGSKRFDAGGKVVAEVPFAPANMQIVDVPDGQGGKIQMLFDPRTSSFAQPQYGGSPAPAPSPGVGAVDLVADYQQLGGMPGVRATSLYRDPENNRRVGGVSNSQHMAGTAGDFVVPAAQKAGFIAQARQMGYEVIDEGDHVHVELPRGVQATSRFGGGDSVGAPRLGYTPANSTGGQFQTMTPDEVAAMGLPQGTVAQRNTRTNDVNVISKPDARPGTGGLQPLSAGEAAKVRRDFKETRDALNIFRAFDMALQEIPGDPRLLADGAARGRLGTAYNNARASLRILYNTGVLQPGELPMLENALRDPITFSAVMDPRTRPQIRAQLDELYRTITRSIENQVSSYPQIFDQGRFDAARGQPDGQAGTYSVGQIIESNGRRFRVTGGDMNDPEVEEVR